MAVLLADSFSTRSTPRQSSDATKQLVSNTLPRGSIFAASNRLVVAPPKAEQPANGAGAAHPMHGRLGRRI